MSYHEGELAMQHRAGVEELARRVGRIIEPDIPPQAAAFLAAQHFVITASVDSAGAVTASIIAGTPGFAAASHPTEATIECAAGGPPPPHVQRVLQDVDATGWIGLLAIDLVTRRRMRLNGVAERRGNAIRVWAREVYSNCPQYIVPREFDGNVRVEASETDTGEPQRWIAEADTFFLATFHPGRGADASHRGGPPGFVRVDSSRLIWPDYPGNNMFNSLGNLLVNPRCGLLFIDFALRRALQLHGTATVTGDETRHVVFELG